MTVSTRALRAGDLDHELLWSAVGTLVAATAWTMIRMHWPLHLAGCAFKAATGVPCLTCGGTRAVEALAAGRFVEALWLNPLVTAAAAGWTAYAAYGLGAIAGAWPRMAVRLDARECTALRIVSATFALAGWIFLVIDGR